MKPENPRPEIGRPTRRLVVFAKLPRSGEVKTRLAPALGVAGATRLYRAFLEDTVCMARRIDNVVREIRVVRHPDAVRILKERYAGFVVREQQDGDLGSRLAGAFDSAFGDGSDYVLIVGSDHPTLPASYVRQGFEALKGAHLVLGPTEDGGYYAIGLRRYAWPKAAGLLDRIAWSTPGVLAETRRRAEMLDLRHVELPSWYDVDEPDQLCRLAMDTDPSSATGRAVRSLQVGGQGGGVS